MPENGKSIPPAENESNNAISLMPINELLKAYDTNKEFPNTKMKIRQEILRRMKLGASNKPN